MRAILVGLALALVAVLIVTAKPRPNETVKVGINKEVRAPKSGLKIRFVELVEDARCPADTTCVWAGNARIKVVVTKNAASETIELNTMHSGEPVKFAGYTFKLVNLTPIPRSNVRINRNAYEATIEVSK